MNLHYNLSNKHVKYNKQDVFLNTVKIKKMLKKLMLCLVFVNKLNSNGMCSAVYDNILYDNTISSRIYIPYIGVPQNNNMKLNINININQINIENFINNFVDTNKTGVLIDVKKYDNIALIQEVKNYFNKESLIAMETKSKNIEEYINNCIKKNIELMISPNILNSRRFYTTGSNYFVLYDNNKELDVNKK